MNSSTSSAQSISLKQYGLENSIIHYQLPSSLLHEITVRKGKRVTFSSGALAVNTGEFTGRSPLDRFIVKDRVTEDKVWWGNINIPFESEKFDALYNKVMAYLDRKEVYVRDCFACADEDYKMGIRVINEYPWSNMFAYN